jgi:C-terminal processing protease CtpA/Prc
MKKILFVLIAWLLIMVPAHAQMSNFGKPEALQILKTAKNEIKKHYYDVKYHGIDLDQQFNKAEEKVKQAQNTGQLMGIIAQTLLDFDDSHLYFSPPSRANKFEYGFQIGAVSDAVVVTAVKPGSDAEKQGLKVGDRLISMGGYPAIREKLWLLRYLFYALRPQAAVRLTIKTPDDVERTIDIQAKIRWESMSFYVTLKVMIISTVNVTRNWARIFSSGKCGDLILKKTPLMP